MDQHERLRHASSFGAAANMYAEHRPDYAQAAVRWALAPAPGPRVLDLGAGTGKLTATLIALGVDVVAVEPDPAMLTELRRSLPGVDARSGSAEAIPLPDASVDVVLAGNAMHWFDMALAGPEIARVLAPGGILAGLWNVVDDQVEWVARLARVSGSAAIGPRDTPAAWRAETADMHLPRTGRPRSSAHQNRRTSRTGSAALPSRSSRRSARGRASWSCRARNEKPCWAASAPSWRPEQRPPTASSPCRCGPQCCASGGSESSPAPALS
ncbi:Methyltransferase domain-containing protein [Glycomyces sambucus]|uniref:Methyltransferase domain-containing protein n=1 Tax=Glycomyces sambucus TaxID=380244 RepID=A0A1G9CHD1_9ACTN|nr:class I SAM-dependent methyltransferase [Glycomyces sambucus]SDK50825.1 Methyltransferase domain-containing protein [Glycomyces sambucus]